MYPTLHLSPSHLCSPSLRPSFSSGWISAPIAFLCPNRLLAYFGNDHGNRLLPPHPQPAALPAKPAKTPTPREVILFDHPKDSHSFPLCTLEVVPSTMVPSRVRAAVAAYSLVMFAGVALGYRTSSCPQRCTSVGPNPAS
jgi:hypothetical protein